MIYQLALALELPSHGLDFEREVWIDVNYMGQKVGRKRVDSLELPIPDREERLNRWREAITKGIATLDPGGAGDDRIDTTWRIRVNVATLEDSR